MSAPPDVGLSACASHSGAARVLFECRCGRKVCEECALDDERAKRKCFWCIDAAGEKKRKKRGRFGA